MKIIKKINTSAALALDSSGAEIVVLGKGIGFPKVPYELTDLSKIERTFYDVDKKYYDLIKSIPNDILLAAAEIAEEAEFELDSSLNPNLPFTLADHLAFAVTRTQQGICLAAPITYDIKHLYPAESKLGCIALDIMEKRTGHKLPDSEAVNIAMHLINAEAESGSIATLVRKVNIINDIEKIIESNLGITFDHESYIYSRFVTHIQFLIERLERGKQLHGYGEKLLPSAAREFPEYYQCALEVNRYLSSEYNWECTEEETLYVMLHISRVQNRQ